MRIGTITPTRGNRPVLYKKHLEYMAAQTRKPDIQVVIDYPQKRFPVDLTERYRAGLEQLKGACDLIFFIEDDDYYPPNYIEVMVKEFEKAGSPEIFGIGETYFYHPELAYGWYRKHPQQGPCAFQMCIRADAVEKIDWSLVNDLFTDAGLWAQLEGKTVLFGRPLSIGIKHGRGACGAGGHNEWFYAQRLQEIIRDNIRNEEIWKDSDRSWLKSAIGEKNALWYEGFAAEREIV